MEGLPRTDATRSSVFGRFVQAHLDELYSSAYRFTRDRVEAEDLVQETLVRAWPRLDPERSEAEIRAFVYRILVNLVLDRRRHDAVRELRPTDPATLPDVPFPPADLGALRRLTRAEVRRAIDSLPLRYRLPVMLVDIDGFSYEEVAEQLGVPVGTVTSRLRRGRLALRRALWRTAAADGIDSDLVCLEAGSLIAAYARGEASPAESAFVETHLQRCLRCREVAEVERAVHRLLRERSCRLPAPAGLRRLASLLASAAPVDSRPAAPRRVG